MSEQGGPLGDIEVTEKEWGEAWLISGDEKELKILRDFHGNQCTVLLLWAADLWRDALFRKKMNSKIMVGPMKYC